MRVPVDWLREYVAVPPDATGEQIAADLVQRRPRGGGPAHRWRHRPARRRPRAHPEPEPQKNGRTINWCTVDVGDANGTGEPQGIVCGAHNFEVGDLVVVILPGGVLTTPQGPLDGQRPQDLRPRVRRHDLLRARARHRRRPRRHPRADPQVRRRRRDPRRARPGHRRHPAARAGPRDRRGQRHPRPRLLLLGARHRARVLPRDRRDLHRPRRRAGGRGAGADRRTASRSSSPTTPRSAAAPAATATSPGSCAASTSPPPRRRWMAAAPHRGGHAARSRCRSTSRTTSCSAWASRCTPSTSTPSRRRSSCGAPAPASGSPPSTTSTAPSTPATCSSPTAVASGPSRSPGSWAAPRPRSGATTRDVLIEAAHFEPVTIARSARRHKLPSEASRRFERGVDPALAAAAAQLAVDLLVEHGGGVADPDVTDVGTPAAPAPVDDATSASRRASSASPTPTPRWSRSSRPSAARHPRGRHAHRDARRPGGPTSRPPRTSSRRSPASTATTASPRCCRPRPAVPA